MMPKNLLKNYVLLTFILSDDLELLLGSHSCNICEILYMKLFGIRLGRGLILENDESTRGGLFS